MSGDLTLRAFTEADLGFLERLDTDPEALGAFEWVGFRDARARRRRWERDGWVGAESTAVAVLLADGTVALFGTMIANRLEATTDADNIAEQKALERVGFTREGVLRGAVFRVGAWRDLVLYGLVRERWGSG